MEKRLLENNEKNKKGENVQSLKVFWAGNAPISSMVR